MTDSYKVLFTVQAQKDIDRLKGPLYQKALKAIGDLELNPEKGHLLQGSLKGFRSLEFSLPGGAYRAAYYVNEEKKECVVFQIGPHEGFYEITVRRAKSLPKE